MPFPTDINAFNAIHCVSDQTGFRPLDPPATSFKDPHFSIWLFTARSIPKILWKYPGEFRKRVDALPILVFTGAFDDLPQWRLAYTALAYIAHAYCWGASAGPELTANPEDFEDATDTLPPQIAVPLKHIASHLGIEPGLTFAGMSAWNWQRKLPILPGQYERKSNLEPIFSFTGTGDEENFVVTAVMVEMAGGAALMSALDASKAAGEQNAARAQVALERLASAIDKCSEHVLHLRDGTSPDVFVNRILPYLTGFGHRGLPQGVLYRSCQDHNHAGKRMLLSGASAAQSSLLPALDVLLGVEHPAESGRIQFGLRMREAMPRPHVRYLEALEGLPRIKDLVASQNTNKPLLVAYGRAMLALTSFRDYQLSFFSTFLVSPAARVPRPVTEQDVKGYTAADVSSILKGMRDDTSDTAKKMGYAARKRSVASPPVGQ